MWRARLTLLLGLLVSFGAFSALIYLNKSDHSNSYGRDAFDLSNEKSPGCKIEGMTLEVFPDTDNPHLLKNWSSTLYVQSNCRKLVMRVPWKMDDLGGATMPAGRGCRWSLRNIEEPQPRKNNDGEQIIHRFIESAVTLNDKRCPHQLQFNGKIERINWFTSRLIISLPDDMAPPTLAATGLDASLILTSIFSENRTRNYEVRFRDRDRESQLHVANIAISTLLGVGIAAIFEAILLLTAVSLIDRRIRDHLNESDRLP